MVCIPGISDVTSVNCGYTRLSLFSNEKTIRLDFGASADVPASIRMSRGFSNLSVFQDKEGYIHGYQKESFLPATNFPFFSDLEMIKRIDEESMMIDNLDKDGEIRKYFQSLGISPEVFVDMEMLMTISSHFNPMRRPTVLVMLHIMQISLREDFAEYLEPEEISRKELCVLLKQYLPVSRLSFDIRLTTDTTEQTGNIPSGCFLDAVESCVITRASDGISLFNFCTLDSHLPPHKLESPDEMINSVQIIMTDARDRDRYPVAYFMSDGGNVYSMPLEGDEFLAKLAPGVENVVSMSSGHSHILFLQADGTVKGCVFSSYLEHYNPIGLGGIDKGFDQPTPIPTLQNVIQISCYENNSIVLCENGDLWACGEDMPKHFNMTDDLRTQFVKVAGRTNVTEIYTKRDFTLFKLTDGSFQVCGVTNLAFSALEKFGPFKKLLHVGFNGFMVQDEENRLHSCNLETDKLEEVPHVPPMIAITDASEGCRTHLITCDDEGYLWHFPYEKKLPVQYKDIAGPRANRTKSARK
mmetsp:Transcript_5467/g.6662  ORF Transcript_5467/g.6662 Transcript_5467/m.6662 type:complete len:526 (-) Transcript_5467:16-1593(-)